MSRRRYGQHGPMQRGVLILILFSLGGVPGALPLTAPASGAQQEAKASDAGRSSNQPAALSLTELSRQAWELASEGDLDDVWQRIDRLAGQEEDSAPQLGELRKDLAAHRARERDRREETRTAYQEKLDELEKQFGSDEIAEALSSAVEAYGLTAEPAKLRNQATVQKVIRTAEQRAAEHENAGHWLRALDLYRGLEMVHENNSKYKDHLDRVARHVSLLRLYAPEQLYQLYVNEAERRGEDKPEPWNFDENGWQTQLEKIESVMLSEAMSLAARSHVEGSSFEDLLLGGIAGLEMILETEGLEKTFPGLADAQKSKAFGEYLDSVRKGIEEREVEMDYSDASKVLDRLLRRNRNTVDLPDAVVIHELGDGATSELDDFSSIIWPHQKSRFERTTSGKFSGVGIQISMVNGELTVVTPLEDTPAHRAGIRPGERIVTINGQSTMGIDLDQAVEKITGPEGSNVTLGIKAAGEKNPREVELTRASIKIVSVKGWQRRETGGGWDYYIDPKQRLGYVRLTTFGPRTADELDAAVQQMKQNKGVNGLILDLRANPGGRLDAAIAVANRFLDDGTIVSTTQKTFLGRSWKATADQEHTFEEFPVVILINKGSASASEIVSGALQDYERALIVGERTFGKGSVQNLFHLGGEKAYLKLTTQYYKLPDGRIIHRRPGAEEWGISPDVNVQMTDQQVSRAVRARTVLDVLRDPEDPEFDPNAILNNNGDDEEDGDNEEAEQDGPEVKEPRDLITEGVDPQLETALLLLKTRILGEGGDEQARR